MTDKEIQARTAITLKTANVTGQSTEAVSEELTAVWNGYKASAAEAEVYVDRLAAVASKTASSLSELATGMSKVASSAASLGISEEQLTAQLSTIIAATRQAPESVGVALKTIYSRITDIQAGIDEDGVTLGTYTGKLAEVGIKVLDNSGKLRNMGDVIEQVGEKWQTFSNEQQIYIAQTMAGQRQYNNLIALFDNYQTGYLKALKTAQTAEGTLTKQNLIYMEDINTKLEQMTAAKESLWMGLIDTRGFKGVIDSLTTIIGKVDSLFRLLGGGKTILNTLGSLATNLMSRTMASGINTFINNRVVSKSRQNWVDFSIDMADKRLKEINEKNPDSTEALILNQKKNFLPMSKYFSRQQMEDVNKAWSESINKAIDADSVRTETQYIENIKEKFGDKLNNTQFEDHFGAFQDMEEIQKRSAKIAEEHQNFVAFMKKDTQLNNIESGYNTAIMRQQENFKNKQIELDKVNQDIEKYKKILQENKGISKDQASEVIKLQQSYRDTVNSLGKKINEQKKDQPRVNIGLNLPMTDTEDTERAKNDAINRISEREQEIKKLEKQKQEYEIQMQQKYGLLPADINIGKKTFKNNLSILSQEDLQAQQEAKKFLKEAEERQEQLNQDIDQSEKKQQELNKKRNQKLVNLFQVFTSEDVEEAKNILKENYKNSTSALSKLEKVNEEWYNNLLQSVGLDQYINAYDNEENSEKRIQELKGLSNINKTIRNAIESHGGEIEFTEIQENLISLFTNAGNIAQDFYNKLGTLEEKRKELVKLSHQAVLAALKSEELAASALRESLIQSVIQFSSGIGQLQSGYQSLINLMTTLQNPNIDGFSKILAVITATANTVFGITTLVNSYKKLAESIKVYSQIKKKRIELQKKDTENIKEHTAAQKVNNQVTDNAINITQDESKAHQNNAVSVSQETQQINQSTQALLANNAVRNNSLIPLNNNSLIPLNVNDTDERNFFDHFFNPTQQERAASYKRIGGYVGWISTVIMGMQMLSDIFNNVHQQELESLQKEIDKEEEKQQLYSHQKEVIAQVESLNRAYEDGTLTIYELQKETMKLQEQYKDESDTIKQLIKDYSNLGAATKKARIETAQNLISSQEQSLKTRRGLLSKKSEREQYGTNGMTFPVDAIQIASNIVSDTAITGTLDEVGQAYRAQHIIGDGTTAYLSTLFMEPVHNIAEAESLLNRIEQYLQLGDSSTNFYQSMKEYYDEISASLNDIRDDAQSLVRSRTQKIIIENDYGTTFEKVQTLSDYTLIYQEAFNKALAENSAKLGRDTEAWNAIGPISNLLSAINEELIKNIDTETLQKYQKANEFIRQYYGGPGDNLEDIFTILEKLDLEHFKFLDNLDLSKIVSDTEKCYNILKEISELNFDNTKQEFSIAAQKQATKVYSELNNIIKQIKEFGIISEDQKTILANQWSKIHPNVIEDTFEEWFKNNFSIGATQEDTYEIRLNKYNNILDTLLQSTERGWENQIFAAKNAIEIKNSRKLLASDETDEKASKFIDQQDTNQMPVNEFLAENILSEIQSTQNSQQRKYLLSKNGELPLAISALIDTYANAIGKDANDIIDFLRKDNDYIESFKQFQSATDIYAFKGDLNSRQNLINTMSEFYNLVVDRLQSSPILEEAEKNQLITTLTNNATTDLQSFKEYMTDEEKMQFKLVANEAFDFEEEKFKEDILKELSLSDLQMITRFLYGDSGTSSTGTEYSFDGFFARIKTALNNDNTKQDLYTTIKKYANISDTDVSKIDLVSLENYLTNFEEAFKTLPETSTNLQHFANEILRFNAGLKQGLPNLSNWIEILKSDSSTSKSKIAGELRNFYADLFQISEAGIEASGALFNPQFLQATQNMLLNDNKENQISDYEQLQNILSASLNQGFIKLGINDNIKQALNQINSNPENIDLSTIQTALTDVIKKEQLRPIVESYFRLQGFILRFNENGLIEITKATSNDDLFGNIDLDILKSINAEKSKQITNQQRLTKYVEDERDLYHDINIELNRISRTLSRLKKEQSGLFGVGLINNLNQQLGVLEKQINANNVKSNIRQQDMAARRQTLSAAGVNFDAAGNITNYLSVVTGALNTLNNKIAEERSIQYQLNQMAGQTDTLEYQNLNLKLKQIQWERQDLEEERSRLQKNISTYDKLREEEEAAADTLADIVRERIAINLQKFDVKVKLKMDLTEAQKSWNDFKRNVLEKDDIFNPNKLISVQKDFNKLYSNMASSYQPLPQLLENLSTVEKELQNFRNNPDYTSELFNNEGQAFSKYQELMSSIENYAENVSSLEDEIKTLILTQLDNAKQTFEKQHDVFSFILNQLQHEQQLAEILYGSKTFDTQAIILNRIVENYQNELELATTEQQFWKDQYDKYLAEGKQAAADKALQNLKTVITKRNSAIENLFNVLNSQYNNLINKIAHNTQLSMTNNLGFDYINMTWDTLQRRSELYLDTVNAAYGIRNTEFAYQEAINNASNLRSQQKIRDVMNEQLNILKSKDKLTQYDVDRAQKILTITQAQIALEEAQNNKTSLRLKRDFQGNYSYQFTADQDAINDAAKKLEDAKNDLYNFDKQALQKNLKDYFNLVTETEKQILEIRLDNNLTQEQKEAKLNELKKRFLEEEAIYVKQNADLKANLGQSELLAYGSRTAEITNLFNSSIQNLIDRSDEVVQLFEQEYDQMNQAAIDYEKTLRDICEKLGIDFDKFKTEGLDPVLETFKQINSNNSEIIETAQTFIDNADSYNTKLTILESTWSNIWTNTNDALTKAQAYVEYILGEDFKKASAALANFGNTNTTVPTTVIPSVGGILDDFGSGFVTASNGSQKGFSESLSLIPKIGAEETSFSWVDNIASRMKNAKQELERQKKLDQFENIVLHGKISEKEGVSKKGNLIWDEEVDDNIYNRYNFDVLTRGASETSDKQRKTFLQNLDNYVIYKIISQNQENFMDKNKPGRFNISSIENYLNSSSDYFDNNNKIWTQKTLQSIFGFSKGQYNVYKEIARLSTDTTLREKIENLFKMASEQQQNYFYNQIASSSKNKDLLYSALTLNGLYQFDTGGYTGDWNSRNGKLAVLHEKELVLNKDDTENILNAIAIMRDTLSSKELQKIVLSNLSEKYVNMYEQAQSNKNNINNYNTQSSPIEQQVQIQANFPNVNNKKQIEAAFSDLVNLATQKALQKNIF